MIIRNFRLGALFAMLAVAGGAFGAHALKQHLTPEHLEVWNKAVFYQFIHALALLLVGVIGEKYTSSAIEKAGWLFTAGIVFFSGSLYILSTRELTGIAATWIGPITPLGGLCFIAGWLLMLVIPLKK